MIEKAKTPEFSVPVSLLHLDEEPKSFAIEADESALNGVAARLELDGLEALSAELTLQFDGDPERPSSGILVDGSVHGKGTQTCVVSLQPVPFEIEADVQGLILSSDSSEIAREELTLEDDEVDILGEIEGDTVDIGEIVVQQLALELDPFPRAEGVEPDWQDEAPEGEVSAEQSPFAALQKLKDSLK